MINTVIFDMDGVLINSEPVHIRNEQELFKELGIEIGEEEHHSFIGVAAREVWGRLAERHHLDRTPEELLVWGRERYLEYLRNGEVPVVEGGIELARYFKTRGYKVLLASSASSVTVKAVLDYFKWQNEFDHTVSSDDILHSKPAPDAFLKAAELAGELPVHCVVIEDSTNGVKAAKSAGAWCIGYQSDLAPRQDLSEADLIVNRLSDVRVETLQQLPLKNMK